jgi:hypothetical protein
MQSDLGDNNRQSTSRLISAILACIAVVAMAPRLQAGDVEFFREYVEPLLARRCYECHSHASEEASGGLVLDSKAGWSVGGDTGPSIVPGKPEESLLWKAVQYNLPHLTMPPDGKLPADELALLERWIREGAADPRTSGKAAHRTGIDLEKGRQWWAFQPVPPKSFSGSLADQIDQRITEKLQDEGIDPAPPATIPALIRRLSFDLTGLPPRKEDLQKIAAARESDRPARVAEYVDRLLASRQFAEKWGRHWLDVARYADSNGSSFNPPFHEAWRYRNWVIDAVDRDLPVNEFIARQLAGDLLPAANQAERDENLIATGYLMLGSKVLGEFDKEQLTLDVIDEQLDTIGKSLLGLTVACARCHDHKFDPIPQSDYYALAGILWSTVTLDDRIGGPKEDESDWSRRGLGDGGDERLLLFLKAQRYAWVKATGKRFQAASKLAELERTNGTAAGRNQEALTAARDELRDAERALAALEAQLPAYAMAPRDADQPVDIPLRVRGVPASHGPVVPRGFLQVAAFQGQPRVSAQSSGRLELAEWVTSDKNPLTARTYVNRVWKHLFREGLVRSVDNFGTTGERPTHPELLDDLTGAFLQSRWRLKPLVRAIVLSQAYQRSSGTPPAEDPENRLFSVQNRRRLEPEEIRDSLLQLSGRLDQSTGDSLIGHLPIGDVSNLGEALRIGDQRRTVYQPVIRTLEAEVLQIFDAPNSAMSTGARSRTIVAPQALYFMNSEFVHQAAERIAEQAAANVVIEADSPRALKDAVSRCFQAIVHRSPTAAEQAVLLGYLENQAAGPSGLSRHDLMKLCQTILASTQFQFIE